MNPWETPTANSLVTAMFAKELRLYIQVLVEISLEMLDDPTTSIIGEADNAIYFTREQFAIGLRFSIPSLVKQFLYFTRTPPVLVHPKVFRILMGCSVLNSLYQLDILPVEICFIYTLKLRIGGCMFMVAHNPRLQFVIELLDFPKTEAKWVVLLRVPWHVMSCSLGVPFDM